MTDLARLAIAVDASQVRQANAELVKFRVAGTEAEVSAAKLAKRVANDNARAFRELGSTLNAVHPVLGQFAGAMRALSTPTGAALVALGGVTAGLGALSVVAGKSVMAFKQLQDEQLRYQAVLGATGMQSGKTADDIEELATSIRKSSTQTEGAVRGAAAQMLRFGAVSGDQFNRAMRLAADLAAVTGQSMESAALMMGRALEDPERGMTQLRRAGIIFAESQQQVIKRFIETGQAAKATATFLDEIERKAGGAAAHGASGLTGAWNQLSEAQNNWLERTGKPIVEVLTQMARAAGSALDSTNKLAEFRATPQGELEAAQANLDRLLGSPNAGRQRGGVTREQQLEAARRRMLGAQLDVDDAELGGAMRRAGAEAGAAAAQQDRLQSAVDGVTGAIQKEIELLRLSALEQRVYNEMKKIGGERTAEQTRSIEEQVRALVREREALELFRSADESLRREMATAGADVRTAGRPSAEREAARREAELLVEAEIRLGSVSEQQRARIAALATEYGRLAAARARSGIREEIEFQQRTIGLTEEQVRIVERLRDLYGNDIPAALASAEAAQLRMIDNTRKGGEALSGLFSGIGRDIREGNLAKGMMDRLLGLGDRILDAQIKAFITAQSAPGGPLSGLAGLLGGALNPGGKPDGTPMNPLHVVVNGGLLGGAGGLPGFNTTPFMFAGQNLMTPWDWTKGTDLSYLIGPGSQGAPSIPGAPLPVVPVTPGGVPIIQATPVGPALTPVGPGAPLMPVSPPVTQAMPWGSSATPVMPSNWGAWANPAAAVPGGWGSTIGNAGSVVSGAGLGMGRFSPQAIQAAQLVSQQTGLPMSSVLAYMQIESGGNPNLISSGGTGSYGGLFQVNRTQFPNWQDPMANARAASGTINQDIAAFQARMGRMPTGAEAYFLHQQGRSGAFAHWNNPQGTAWENLRPFYSSERMAQRAVADNMPRELRGMDPRTITSGEFSRGWESRFNNTERLMGNPWNNAPTAPGAQDLQNSLNNLTTSTQGATLQMTAAGTGLQGMAGGLEGATGGLGNFASGLQSALSNIGGGGGGGGFNLGNIFGGGGGGGGGIPDFQFPWGHTGGIVGQLGNGRFVHPAYFDGAPRYRSGGLVGLAPDDVPIIAHRGEEVLTETNPRHRRNVDRMPGRGPTIQLVIPDATPEKIAQSRGQLARTMAIAQKMAQRHN